MFKLRQLFGKRYLLNTDSGEVHDLKEVDNSYCYGLVKNMDKKNRKFLTHDEMTEIMFTRTANGKLINGCKFCLKRYNSEKKKKPGI